MLTTLRKARDMTHEKTGELQNFEAKYNGSSFTTMAVLKLREVNFETERSETGHKCLLQCGNDF